MCCLTGSSAAAGKYIKHSISILRAFPAGYAGSTSSGSDSSAGQPH